MCFGVGGQPYPGNNRKIRLEIFFFMEDNARPHATTLTQTYLKNRCIQKIECPPKSKNLNQIENV